MRSVRLFAILVACLLGGRPSWTPAQQLPPPPPAATTTDSAGVPLFQARSNLVLVPALVRDKSGEPVFTLTADQFTLTDDGVPQKLTLEEDTDAQPIAMVVLVEVGGAGGRKLDDYSNLGSVIEAVVGNVPHRVAVVGFDSTPRVVEGFTPNLNQVATALHDIEPGDSGAAIFDALGFAIDMLRKEPPVYRRAILMFSETLDHGSHLQLEDALRAVSDTNTAIYSFGFSSTKASVGHEAVGFSDGRPGPAGGCMAKDPNADPLDSHGRLSQAWECLSLLAPPLRAAKIAAILGMNAMRRNVPESVAQLTGGEFYSFKDQRSLERGLLTLSNHIPNRYVLSFSPQSPHPGAHLLALKLNDYPNLTVTARKSYWADGPPGN